MLFFTGAVLMISCGWIAQIEGNFSSKYRSYITKYNFYNEHLMYYTRKLYFPIKAEKEANVMGIDKEWKDFLNAFQEFRREEEMHGRAQKMDETQNRKDNILGTGKTTLE